MMDSMRAAVKSRRAHALNLHSLLSGGEVDDAKLQGGKEAAPHEADGIDPNGKSVGDLAPEVHADEHEAPEKSASQERAIHAKDEGHGIQHLEAGAIMGHELDNPEHHPLERSAMGVDMMGHEQDGHDPDVQSHILGGHENEGERRPRTLGARVRAALQSQKGK